jgi:hypothetical protein
MHRRALTLFSTTSALILLFPSGTVAATLPIVTVLCSAVRTAAAAVTTPPHVAIGDVLLCRVNATVPRGVNPLTMSALWTTGLAIRAPDAAVFRSVPPTSTSSLQTTATVAAGLAQDWYFGQFSYAGVLPAAPLLSEPVIVEVELNVTDIPALVAGGPLSPSGAVNISNTLIASAAAVQATIAEPTVVIASYVATAATAEAGALVLFVATVTHTGTATGDANVPAYELVLAMNATAVGIFIPNGNASTALGTISVSGSIVTVRVPVLAVGQSFAANFSVYVTDVVFPNQTITSTATLQWR